MGYEIAATPLQLALAYATFANGGELVEPALVKEVVGPDGVVRYRHDRRVARRVVPQSVADKIRTTLLDVVDEGTALQAALDNYLLAGKTGTPRATMHGHYVAGRYNPNFVGLFPGDAPQFVIVVKLIAPRGTFYGGTTAAPLTKAILQAAIAARDAALDRTKLASSVMPGRRDSMHPDSLRTDSGRMRRASADPARLDSTELVARLAGSATPDSGRHDSRADDGSIPYVVTLPLARDAPRHAEAPHVVPEVRGLALRDAVRSLHSAGFRVQLARAGASLATAAGSTSPAAGALAPPGSLVRLLFTY